SKPVNYLSQWQQDQVNRSAMATLQYLGLKNTIPEVAASLKLLSTDQGDFKNLVEAFVLQQCSPNITVMAQKTIIQEINDHYTSELIAHQMALKSFSSFCSWGNKVDQPRLLRGY